MRIYLDNAATSWPKPPMVFDSVDRWQRENGSSLGRGAYSHAVELDAEVAQCRRLAAGMFGAESPERIIFTFNGTDSLNMALHGVLRPGDHVITTTLEHNSVLRPLRFLESQGVVVTYLEPPTNGQIEPTQVRDAMRPETRLVAMIAASNVTGVIQPINDVGRIAKERGALFLVDAAQTAGHVPMDLSDSPIDLLACPGHKGLLGPLGTGLLYLREGLEEIVQPIRRGGTGSLSETPEQPMTLPDRYESGNHNSPGLVGLKHALEFLSEKGVAEISSHEHGLTQKLIAGFESLPKVDVHLAGNSRIGVVSANVQGVDPQIVGGMLDEAFGVQVRAGLHCAPGAHRFLGTLDLGGSVRFSTGAFTTDDEIDSAIAAMAECSSVLG